MDTKEALTAQQISDMKHAIGYQPRCVKKGKYEPYRNYYTASTPNEDWEDLISKGYACKFMQFGSIVYQTTKSGRAFLSTILGCEILQESR